MRILVGKVLQTLSLKHQTIGRRAFCIRKFVDIGQPTPASHPQLMKEGEITPSITLEEYTLRRKRFLELLPDNGLAIIAAVPVKMMNDVVPYTYRQDADYSYLTGCQQPGGIAVLGHECGFCMFMPEATSQDVTWQGETAGVGAAVEVFKADKAYPMSKLREILPDMMRRSSKLFHSVQTAVPKYIELNAFQKAVTSGEMKDVSVLTHELRLKKSSAELKLMKESASIACQALLQTMLHSKKHPYEGMLSAKMEYECKMRVPREWRKINLFINLCYCRSNLVLFNPVVGGGPNARLIYIILEMIRKLICIVVLIKEGDLVLMDVGCEFHGYVSDRTRTWPPWGTFSSAQVELYDLILETNKECVKLCKPGAPIWQIHDFSVVMLQKGLKELGILKEESRRSSHHHLSRYYQLNPTSIGHYLGMDVHDCSKVSYDHPLTSGIMISIEPGIYIPLISHIPERYQGIGIRIEDEVLITDTGCEVLTASIPKEVKHIESLLNNFHH